MIVDQRGNEVILGNPYLFVFGGPGPDVTLLISKSFTEEGKVLCYDCFFEREIEVKPEKLFQRYQFQWGQYEIDAVKKFDGNYQFMVDHNNSLASH